MMNKEKTGELIRQARLEKGLTQLQLGDLIGVTNKAVSRWENGESFPDVALLDSLSDCLDLKIEELVLGEKKSSIERETILKEFVQEIRLQRKARTRDYLVAAGCVFVLVFLIWLGFRTLYMHRSLNWLDKMYIGSFAVVLSTTIILLRPFAAFAKEAKGDKLFTAISGITGLYLTALMLGIIISLANGIMPFRMQPKQIGSFIGWQLTAIYTLNLFFLTYSLGNRIRSKDRSFFSVCVYETFIYIPIIYNAILSSLAKTTRFVLNEVIIDTLLVFGIGAGGILAGGILGRKKQ